MAGNRAPQECRSAGPPDASEARPVHVPTGWSLSGRGNKLPFPTARDLEWITLYQSGQTLQQIGDAFGVTRERVRQRLTKNGLKRRDGGAWARPSTRSALSREQSRRAGVEQRFFDRWGMSREGVKAISPLARSDKNHPFAPYIQQRNNAARRGIEWRFKFASWWAIWVDSGKWEQRGRGQGYVMARWADDGPYSPENVYICTAGENSKDSYITKPAAGRAAKARITREARAHV